MLGSRGRDCFSSTEMMCVSQAEEDGEGTSSGCSGRKPRQRSEEEKVQIEVSGHARLQLVCIYRSLLCLQLYAKTAGTVCLSGSVLNLLFGPVGEVALVSLWFCDI